MFLPLYHEDKWKKSMLYHINSKLIFETNFISLVSWVFFAMNRNGYETWVACSLKAMRVCLQSHNALSLMLLPSYTCTQVLSFCLYIILEYIVGKINFLRVYQSQMYTHHMLRTGMTRPYTTNLPILSVCVKLTSQLTLHF